MLLSPPRLDTKYIETADEMPAGFLSRGTGPLGALDPCRHYKSARCPAVRARASKNLCLRGLDYSVIALQSHGDVRRSPFNLPKAPQGSRLNTAI